MSRRGQRRDRRFRRFTVDGVDGSLMFSVGVHLLNGTAEVGIEFVGMDDERTSLIATWIQSEISEADPSVGD